MQGKIMPTGMGRLDVLVMIISCVITARRLILTMFTYIHMLTGGKKV